ncbi:uncharacterized protein [Dermacentor albipictus]|uniref:uncharacterized protein isoform X3 n=1 Tax=Dermacentor albipictus TaxID=60249 RepID=UPI0031FC4FEE
MCAQYWQLLANILTQGIFLASLPPPFSQWKFANHLRTLISLGQVARSGICGDALHRFVTTHAEAPRYTQTCKLKVQPTGQYPHLLLKLQGHKRIHMCSVLCTGRKLLAHSRNCKLWLFYVQAHHTHQYPRPLLELQGHTRNHMCLVVYASLLRHMLKLPASQSCNLLIHRTGRYPHIQLELQGHKQIHKCLVLQTCSTLTKSLRQTDKLYIRWHID